MSHSHHHGNCTHSHFDFSHVKSARLKKLATYASVLVALMLIVSKIIAWKLTGSVGILSSLADSCLDMIASTANLFAVRHAMHPPDKEHRFGHGKIEALSALGQASIIVVSVMYVLYEACEHLSHTPTITEPGVGMIVMIVSIILTTGLVFFQTYVVNRTHSIAITADSMHYRADLLLNIGVLGVLVITYYIQNLRWLDPIVGIAIALYILYTSWAIGAKAVDILLDRELSDKTRKKIIESILSHKEVKGYHDLRTRSCGLSSFIQVHIELEGALSLHATHKISDKVEDALLELFHNAQVLIHQDPAGLKERHSIVRDDD